MEVLIYKKEDNLISKWSGGTTRQLGIWPIGSSYLKRDFKWRISTATVDEEETDFTLLPGFDRIILVLEGEIILSFEGERITRLSKNQQDRFSGGTKTKSYGKIVDFNLIYNNKGDGYLEILELEKEKKNIEFENHLSDTYEFESNFFYCLDDYAIIVINEIEYFLKQDETLVLSQRLDGPVNFGVMGNGKIIHGIIRFDNEDDIKIESKTRIRPTKEDFKISVSLFLTSFRGSRYISKFRRENYLDKELKKGISKIEKAMIPFLIGIIGLIVSSAIAIKTLTPEMVIFVLALWMIIDIFLISPLIYAIMLPKPIKAHIKKISEMTNVEIEEAKKEINVNDTAERILKKYKISGRN